MFQGKCPIISNKEVMPGINLLTADAPEIASCAGPGQFVMIACDRGLGSSRQRLLRRPISLHRVTGNTISLLFARVGGGTEWLAGCKLGEAIDLLGPMGKGFSIPPESHRLLLVAGGMGVAPLCYLAGQAVLRGHRVRILLGAKTSSLICPGDLIPDGVETVFTTEDGTAGRKGLVTSLLAEYLPQAERAYICGPLPMYQAIHKNYPEYVKNTPVQVSLEVRMGCGLGFCYACTIRTNKGLKQVCKDGPVFNWDEIAWEDLK